MRNGNRKRYDPADWYWLADDGRLFASARVALVAATDAVYVAWGASGGVATVWPRDDAGNQTIAALQDVLAPRGLYADLKAYAAARRYAKEVGGTSINGVAYPTDRETQAKMAAAVLMAQVTPSQTFKWKVADGSFVSLDAAGITAVAVAVGAFVQACFATEDSVAAGVAAGGITSTAQIDAAFA